MHAALVDGGGAPAGLAGFLSARRRAVRCAARRRRARAARRGARRRGARLAEGAERDALSAVQRALATRAPAAAAAVTEASPRKSAPALRAPSSSVYVGGLHGSQLDGAKEALAAELGKWGDVAKVTLKRFKNSGYGFVAFSSQKDAEAAVSAYVSGEYVPFDDPKIVLNFGKAPGVAEEEEKGAEKPARRLVSASAAKREAAAAAAAAEEEAAAAAAPGRAARQPRRCTSPRSCPARRPG